MKIKNLKKIKERIETGAIQFGEDWPGIYLRGGDALWFGYILKMLNEKYPFDEVLTDIYQMKSLKDFIELLYSCHVEKDGGINREDI